MAWHKLFEICPVVAYVRSGDRQTDIEMLNGITKIRKKHGNIIQIYTCPRIPSIDYGVQGKISRLFLAAALREETSLIADIDMIPLQKNLLDYADGVQDNMLIQFGYDHPSFQKHPDIGKWPMDRTTASGNTFAEIINPENLGYEQLLTSWTGFEEDHRSNVFNTFSQFSDESLLYCLWKRWKGRTDRTLKIPRNAVPVPRDVPKEHLHGRLYKHAHPETAQLNMDNFYEVHGPRPLTANYEWYNPVIEYLSEKTK
jgi:hypothetical protein